RRASFATDAVPVAVEVGAVPRLTEEDRRRTGGTGGGAVRIEDAGGRGRRGLRGGRGRRLLRGRLRRERLDLRLLLLGLACRLRLGNGPALGLLLGGCLLGLALRLGLGGRLGLRLRLL